MINLNLNQVIVVEEFVLFFLVNKSSIEKYSEEVIKRNNENKIESEPEKSFERTLKNNKKMAAEIVDTTYD